MVTRHRFVGDSFPARAQPTFSDFRVWCHNVDSLPTAASFQDELAAIVAADADVVILLDVRWKAHTRNGVLAMLRSSWSRGLTHYEWHNDDPDVAKHGIFVAVREESSVLVAEPIPDPRGWARFGGIRFMRRGGGSVAVFGVYATPYNLGAAGTWMATKIKALADDVERKLSVHGLLRLDLEKTLLALEVQGVPSVVLGDWNVSWHPDAHLNPLRGNAMYHAREWHRWFEVREEDPLVNAFYVRGHPATPTFRRQNATNDMDFALGRASFFEETLVRAGVWAGLTLGDAPPSRSEHCPIAIALNLSGTLGVHEERLRTPRKTLNPHSFAVRTDDDTSVELYRRYVARRWQAASLDARVAALGPSPSTQTLDELYTDATACMNGAASDVHVERHRRYRSHLSAAAHRAVAGSGPRRRVLRELLILSTRGGRGHRARAFARLRRSDALALRALQVNLDVVQPLVESVFAPGGDVAARQEAAALLEEHRLVWHTALADANREHAAALQDAETEALRRRAEARDEDGRVKVRGLVRTIMARDSKKGGKYASIVRRGADGQLDIENEPDGVARVLLGHFDQWMGHNRNFWYESTDLDADTPRGRALRRAIADRGSAIDTAAAGIPSHFAPVLDHLKRLPQASEADYVDVLAPLQRAEWNRYWSSRKSGKSPGLTGVTADMVKTLPDAQQDGLLALLNAASAARHVFPQWKQRAIVPIPKIPGSVDLANARPISLLDVVSKAFWSLTFKRITGVWEKRGFFDAGQYGSRAGCDVQTPLAIAVSLSELASADEVPLLAVASDISKAFDSIPTFLGKEAALRRFGLPDEFLDYYLDMDRGNEAQVVTAYGSSSEILGRDEGVFSFVRGTPQGSSESPAIWIAFNSILMDMQCDPRLVPEGRVDVTGVGLRRPSKIASSARCVTTPFDSRTTACGSCFVDDALYYATSRRGLEMRLAVCNVFFAFFEVQFNVRKTKALGLEFFKGPIDIHAEGWKPWVYDNAVIFTAAGPRYGDDADHIGSASARTGEVAVVPLAKGVRYLGITWSPAVDHLDVSASLTAVVDDFLKCMEAVPVSLANTSYMIENVLWAKLAYQFRFARFVEPFVDKLQREVEAMLLKRAKLCPNISHAVLQIPATLGGPALPRWHDKIFADRLEWIERLLRRGGLAGRLVEALILQSQMQWGSSSSVFASPLAANSRWATAVARATVRFGWVQGAIVWAAEHDVQLAGTPSLPGAAGSGDVTIVDLATHAGADLATRGGRNASLTMVRRTGHDVDIWWTSSFLRLDGKTFNSHVVPPDASNRGAFVRAVRGLLGVDKRDGFVAPQFRATTPAAGVARGDVALCRIDGAVRFVEVQDTAASVATVRLLAGRRFLDAPATGPADGCIHDAWYEGTVAAVRGSGARARVTFRVHGEDHDLAVADVRSFRDADYRLDASFDDAMWFVVSDSEHDVSLIGMRRLPVRRASMDREFARASLRVLATPAELATELVRYESSLSGDLSDDLAPSLARMGVGVASALSPAAARELHGLGLRGYDDVVAARFPESRQPVATATLRPPDRDHIYVASDGSECLGSGGAGAVVYDPVNGKLYSLAVRVDAGPGVVSSFRAEAIGAFVAQRACRLLAPVLPRLPISAIIDNKGVVAAFDGLSRRLPTASNDAWDELVADSAFLRQHFGGLQLDWVRGHPERTCSRSEFTWQQCLQHLSDGLAAAGRQGRGGADPSAAPGVFRHGRRWFVCVRRRRIFDGVRATLLHHVGVTSLCDYEHATPAPAVLALRSRFLGPSRDIWTRVMNTKFVLAQLSTLARTRQWGFDVPDAVCRCCKVPGSDETLEHLLVECPKLGPLRDRYVDALATAAASMDGGDALAAWLRRVLLVYRGRLLCSDASSSSLLDSSGALLVDADAASRRAYGFVRGRFPASLVDLLVSLAPSGGDVDVDAWPSIVLGLLGRVARNRLWQPVWRAWREAAAV